jgi:signal transduction histidine kinase/ActR/RegA family two-component response regulator
MESRSTPEVSSFSSRPAEILSLADEPAPLLDSSQQPSLARGDRLVPAQEKDDFDALFDESRMPSWIVDDQTSAIRAANRAALLRSGYDHDAMLALELETLLVLDENREAAPLTRGELRARDGACAAVDVVISPVRFAGRPARLLQVQLVGTPSVGAAAEWAERLARSERERMEAESANRAKDEFLAILSHELRAPLGSILIWTQLLRTGGLDEPATTRALGMIERSTETLQHFIEDLLDISRIIAGKLNLEVRPTDLASVVQAATEEAQPALAAKAIRLTSVIDRELPPASGDPARLQQVVRNLLSNACKFTPEGGSVHVELDHVDGHARIRVTDTGVGIPRDFLATVFERFRQVDNTSSRSHRGLGLGLAIVRHLVELHGGTVSAESPGHGQGTTFTIVLPLITSGPPGPVESVASNSEWSLDETALAGVRILLVDDEEDARESLRVLLERSGADVRAVKSAAEALAQLEGFRPHVLLSDIAMPEEDGYRLIRKVRALDPERGGRTAAVALTAYASREDRRAALLAGYQDHVAKPPDPPRLIELLAKLARSSTPL